MGGSASDQEFGVCCMECAAAGGCCIEGVKFSCEHGKNRMVLPLDDPNKHKRLVLVADKGAGQGSDKLTVEVEHSPNALCGMSKQLPRLSVIGSGMNVAENTKKFEAKLEYPEADGWVTGSDLAMFAKATKETIFGDVTNLGAEIPFDVEACGGGDQWSARLEVFPKIEWKATGFTFEISGTFSTDFTFVPSVSIGGKLEGKYLDSTFSVGASAATDQDRQGHSKSVVPFLDSLLEKMASMTGDSGRAGQGVAYDSDDYNQTRSSIKIYHKFSLADASFKIAEHPTDHTQVGIESKVKIGYDPLLGMEVTLDVLDALLTAAKAYPPAAGLARVIEKAREYMAEGIGSKDGPLYASAHAAVTMSIDGQIGAGYVEISRGVADSSWNSGSTGVGGSLEIKIQAIIRGEGKAYFVKGTVSGDATGSSKLSATLSTLTQQQMRTSSGAKFNAKIEWDGVGVTFKASAALEAGIFQSSASTDSGRLEIFPPHKIYDKNF